MGDLLSVLSQAAWSLGTQRSAASTAGHNLENVNTPGYSRQRVSLRANDPANVDLGSFVGRGVTLGSIAQVRDRFLEAQVPGAFANDARSSARSRSLEAVTIFATDAPDGLGNALDSFFAGLRTLTQSPGDTGLRQAAVASARSLAAAFNNAATSISSVRDGIDGEIAASVGEINELSSQIASLNGRIRTARATGAEPNDLLDLRQKAQDQLVELTGAVPVSTGDGDVSLVLSRGSPLVSADRASTLSTEPDPTNGGRPRVVLTPPAGGSATVLGLQDLGGTVGGLLSARDETLAGTLSRLDALAFDLATAVNTQHRAGTGLDGSTGNDLFAVSTTATGAASSLTIAAGVDTNLAKLATSTAGGGAGDATNLQKLVDLERLALAGGNDPSRTLASLVATFGSDAAQARLANEHDSTFRAHLEGLRASASGVSIDDEMIAMTQAQRAYEAVSRVVTSTNAMLDTLMQLGR